MNSPVLANDVCFDTTTSALALWDKEPLDGDYRVSNKALERFNAFKKSGIPTDCEVAKYDDGTLVVVTKEELTKFNLKSVSQ
ncbi:MAG: hypothetical protein ACRC5A_03405 [Enterobacteriaceae bacterium]